MGGSYNRFIEVGAFSLFVGFCLGVITYTMTILIMYPAATGNLLVGIPFLLFFYSGLILFCYGIQLALFGVLCSTIMRIKLRPTLLPIVLLITGLMFSMVLTALGLPNLAGCDHAQGFVPLLPAWQGCIMQTCIFAILGLVIGYRFGIKIENRR